MSLQQNSLSKYIFYFVKVLGVFFILYAGSNWLISASTESGRFYLPFISDYLNIPMVHRNLIFMSSGKVLEFIGFEMDYSQYHIWTKSGYKIQLVWSCLSYDFLALYLSIILVTPGSGWVNKVIWLLIGLVSLICLNVLRIVGIVLFWNKGYPISQWPMDHHWVYNIFAFLLIGALVLLKLKLKKTNFPPQSHLARDSEPRA